MPPWQTTASRAPTCPLTTTHREAISHLCPRCSCQAHSSGNNQQVQQTSAGVASSWTYWYPLTGTQHLAVLSTVDSNSLARHSQPALGTRPGRKSPAVQKKNRDPWPTCRKPIRESGSCPARLHRSRLKPSPLDVRHRTIRSVPGFHQFQKNRSSWISGHRRVTYQALGIQTSPCYGTELP